MFPTSLKQCGRVGTVGVIKQFHSNFTVADGLKSVVSSRQHGFTRNGPSTFVIQPKEHQVYAIRLDMEWEARPGLPKADEIPIKLQAVYEVSLTSEATQYKVWTGRVKYNRMLRQW